MNEPSKFEKKIMKIFNENGIHYRREVSYKGLVGPHGMPLRFDFAVIKDGKLVCLVEADGAQHFKYTPFFHKNIFGFQKAKEWDRKKNQFCLQNGIPLIRIPYWAEKELTLNDIFNNPKYKVKSKYHTDYLMKEMR